MAKDNIRGTVATNKEGRVDVVKVANHYVKSISNIPENFGFSRAGELQVTLDFLISRVKYLEKKIGDERWKNNSYKKV